MATKTNHTLDVEFGGVSIGDETARIGLRVAREKIPLELADKLFCGRRLTCHVEIGTNGDDPGQKRTHEDAVTGLDAACDIKRFTVGPKYVGAGLTFPLGEIDDVGTLAHMAKRHGRLVVTGVADIPEDEEDDDEGEDPEAPTLFDGEGDPKDGPCVVAHREGRYAAEEGKSATDCPYATATVTRTEWMRGFNEVSDKKKAAANKPKRKAKAK